MPRPTESPSWLDKVAICCVQDGVDLYEAHLRCDVSPSMTKAEAKSFERRLDWQKALTRQRRAYYRALASDPNADKLAAIGHLYALIDAMDAAGQFRDAAAAIVQLAKLQGWTEADGAPMILNFGPKELSALRAEWARRKATLVGTVEAVPKEAAQ